MRTLFGKILLWFWCTIAITVIGSAFVSALTVNEEDPADVEAPVTRLVRFQLEQARATYEMGGRPALHSFMEALERIYGAKGILADSAGRDLLTGEDRLQMVNQAKRRPPFQIIRAGTHMVARAADDGSYWFFLILPRQTPGAWFLRPEHLFMLGAAILLCYWLAFHLARPVRDLQKAVERFGCGDLTSRVGSERRDELGQLARTFDRMAGRIETLLAAERTLLLDISHELRSPLARLGVAIELARSGEDLNAALNRIQKESDRLNSLVGELLQVTRAEGDPNSLRRDKVRLDELVQQLVDDSTLEATSRGCEVKFEKHEPVTVQGDPELLRRAVENVIRNAIRYTPPKTAVEVSMGRNNGHVVVDVRDHGPGVPDDALPKLFTPFYRVETDRNRNSGGIGLGLSIARRAVELHKGSIRAKNASPGLEVEMELPVSG